jgi:ribosomal protein S18 acetylase RimI-like enzyme
MKKRFLAGVHALRRFALGLQRPTKSGNARRLTARGETIESFTFRDATIADAAAVARLHVTTFNQTHLEARGTGPTVALRESQWRETLSKGDEHDFCIVIERADGELVGFARGTPSDDSEYPAQLNKIYLLRDYQRLGLGRCLVGHVVRRFLRQGLSSMQLFSEAYNPSVRFYDALGGERWLSETGEFHGGFRWRDLRQLAAICPVD